MVAHGGKMKAVVLCPMCGSQGPEVTLQVYLLWRCNLKDLDVVCSDKCAVDCKEEDNDQA
jgi:hypothetical protein